ncbi:hypothetical protein OESDEN_20773, partial [Oesophagostomum dentatum]
CQLHYTYCKIADSFLTLALTIKLQPRIVSDAFRYNQAETFAFLLKYMDGEQLRNATEVIDRIQGRRDTNGERLRHAMRHRQMTID